MYGLLKKSANTRTHEKIHWEEKFPTEPNICHHIVATLGATAMNIFDFVYQQTDMPNHQVFFFGIIFTYIYVRKN